MSEKKTEMYIKNEVADDGACGKPPRATHTQPEPIPTVNLAENPFFPPKIRLSQEWRKKKERVK